jgi:glycerol-3-phosphate acyltransferase PlsY
MNVSRELGWRAGIATFACDALKGALPVAAAYFLYRNFTFENSLVVVSDFMRYFCGLFVVIGHIFPVTMKFKGGKGIASTFGVFWGGLACENAWWALAMLGCCLLILLFIYATEWGGLGSLLGVSSFSVIQLVYFYFRYEKTPFNAYLVCVFVTILLLNIFTWLAHYKNLRRLFSGEEHRTSLKKIAKKK